MVAFAVGEQINEDTLVVHIEKAFSEVPGAYAIINQQFLVHEADGLKYVNREDDVGEPGLRKAKLSYHPEFLVEKGFARLERCLKNHSGDLLLDNCVSHSRYFSNELDALFFEKARTANKNLYK